MEEIEHGEPWVEIESMVQSGDIDQLDEYMTHLPPGESARALSRMDDEEQAEVFGLLPQKDAAALLEELYPKRGQAPHKKIYNKRLSGYGSEPVPFSDRLLVNCRLSVAGRVLVRENQLFEARAFFSDMKRTSIRLLELIPGH